MAPCVVPTRTAGCAPSWQILPATLRTSGDLAYTFTPARKIWVSCHGEPTAGLKGTLVGVFSAAIPMLCRTAVGMSEGSSMSSDQKFGHVGVGLIR